MAFKVPKIPVCVAIVCCVVALIFQVVAVAGTGWLVSVGDNSGELGLFRSCVNSVCTDVPDILITDWWKACQALSILGLLTIAGGLGLGILHSVSEDTSKASLAGMASCVASMVSLSIGLVVFGLESSSLRQGLDFGYGFIFSIVACIFSFVAAVLFAIGLRMS